MPIFQLTYRQYYTTYERLTVNVEAPDEASLQAALEDYYFDVNAIADKADVAWDEYHTEQDESPSLTGVLDCSDCTAAKPDITLDDIIAINAERATCGAETAENPS